jgi:hypothetical protein
MTSSSMTVCLEVRVLVCTNRPGVLCVYACPKLASVDLRVTLELRHIEYSFDQGNEILRPARRVLVVIISVITLSI